MALKIINTSISRFICCGAEKNTARITGKKCFGKWFALTKNSSTGVGLTVNRTSSPIQMASTGIIVPGNAIYFGDTITISVTASSGYTNPKLYVNAGDGNGTVQRTSPFTFTVVDDVSYYGNATPADTWQTVWTGSKTFTTSGMFTVPGLTAGGKVQVTANAVFLQEIVDYNDNSEYTETATGSVNRIQLPAKLWGLVAYIDLSRGSNDVSFIFRNSEDYTKAYEIHEKPQSITITEVRRQA